MNNQGIRLEINQLKMICIQILHIMEGNIY